MSIDAMRWAWKLQEISPTEKLILLSLADRAGETHEAWPSWRRLQLDTLLSRNTIAKNLSALQAKGLILNTGQKKGQVIVYRLIGVAGRDDEAHLHATSTKIGTGTSTKIGTGTKQETKRETKGKKRPCSCFFLFKRSSKPHTRD